MSDFTEHKEREPKQQKQQQQKKQKQSQQGSSQQSKENSNKSQQSKESGNKQIHNEESSKQPRQRATPKLALFDHLPTKIQDRPPSIQSDSSIHPAIIKLGALYQTGSIQDDDDRAYALWLFIM